MTFCSRHEYKVSCSICGDEPDYMYSKHTGKMLCNGCFEDDWECINCRTDEVPHEIAIALETYMNVVRSNPEFDQLEQAELALHDTIQ